MRALFPPFVAALSLVSAFSAGCAGPGTAGAGGELAVYGNGHATSMRVEGDRAWGPTVELTRFDGAYRGTLDGNVVDVRFDGERVHGTIGRSVVDLHVSTEGGKIHGQGLLNGHLSTFDVDDESIDGSFGSCAYEMKRKAESEDYVGYRSCASVAPWSHVTIPAYVHRLDPVEQGALYALLLS